MDIKRFHSDKNGVAPAIAAFLWLLVAVGAIGGVYIAVTNLTQRPDITYNISDTGVSFAGIDVSWFAIIGVVILIIIVVIWLGRRRQPVQPLPPRQPFFQREFR